jgi:hypothetical protein
MNSPHEDVEVLWPRDTGPLSLKLDGRLMERHRTGATLIGANLVLPDDLVGELDTANELVGTVGEGQ